MIKRICFCYKWNWKSSRIWSGVIMSLKDIGSCLVEILANAMCLVAFCVCFVVYIMCIPVVCLWRFLLEPFCTVLFRRATLDKLMCDMEKLKK